MDFQTTKIKLLKAILDIDSAELIKKILDLIQTEAPDFWDELSGLEQQEIEKGIKQLDNGQRVPFGTAFKQIS